MEEITIWGVIKTCIVILLILYVIKKILKIWREHEKEVRYMDDPNYRASQDNLKLSGMQMSENLAEQAINAVKFEGGFTGGAYEYDAIGNIDYDEIEIAENDFTGVANDGSFLNVLSKIKPKEKKKSNLKSKPKKKTISKAKKSSSKKKGKN